MGDIHARTSSKTPGAKVSSAIARYGKAGLEVEKSLATPGAGICEDGVDDLLSQSGDDGVAIDQLLLGTLLGSPPLLFQFLCRLQEG